MELWKLILIAVGVAVLINFLFKKLAFLFRALLIIVIVLVIVYFFRDKVVGLLVG